MVRQYDIMQEMMSCTGQCVVTRGLQHGRAAGRSRTTAKKITKSPIDATFQCKNQERRLPAGWPCAVGCSAARLAARTPSTMSPSRTSSTCIRRAGQLGCALFGQPLSTGRYFVSSYALLSLAALYSVVAQDISAGSSCAAVLQQGVYNTFQSSNSGSSFSEAHTSACMDYSEYSYE